MFTNLSRFAARLHGWRLLAASALLGALTALALAPLHLVPVLWLTLPGLLLLLDVAPGRWRALAVGWAWGWGFQVAGLYWITEAILVEADR
ncbi:apolipoprotein N-acyltransferase, partial [Roseomonas sp. DSM 102946]|nr:apolipoprotein N-acyltransferase [Roseomonas sp. DSM 102946]